MFVKINWMIDTKINIKRNTFFLLKYKKYYYSEKNYCKWKDERISSKI